MSPGEAISAPTRLLLVRHGQSEWNAAGRWQGQADPPLSSLGRAQALSAAAGLPPFDVMVASSLRRAAHTAEIMAAEAGHETVHLEPRLVERDAGGFSGLTRAEIEVEYPGYLEAGRWPEGWESEEDLVSRVRAGLVDIGETIGPGATVVVITHAGCIYSVEGILGADFERIPNLAGRWVELSDGGFELGPRVHLLDAADETIPDQL